MKLSYILVLLSICSWSDVSDGLTASLHHQDTVVPAGSHNCEGPVNLPYKILNYNTLYVCTHGLVSFGSPVTLPGDTIAHHTDTPVIAVNWHNFNTLHTTGRVYYRSTQSDTSLLASTSDVIQTALSHAGYNNFRSRWALVVTWLNVTASQSDGSSTFQLILTSDAQRNVMIFHYDTLSHSGKVGFNGRDGSNYYQHSAAELLTGTNAGFPGRWVFPVNTVPVRLVDSRGRPRQGRVEVLYNGTWGTVCDDGFTDISAKVICSQLDYGYLGYVLRTVHDAGTGPIWLDKVQCRGTEADLGQCSHLAWGHSECTHQQDVSIACYNRSIAATSTPHVGWFFALTGVILLVISAVVWKLYRYRNAQSERKAVKFVPMPMTA